MRTVLATLAVIALANPAAAADALQATMRIATPTGPGAEVGTVSVSPGAHGAELKVVVHGLPPGPHGFHVHENGSCDPSTANGTVTPAGAAGGHMDPGHTGHHMGPDGMGHLGDLPLLIIGQDGQASVTLSAPHITDVAALKGHALMIHAGGDNYSDEPALGGGGARIACGVLQ